MFYLNVENKLINMGNTSQKTVILLKTDKDGEWEKYLHQIGSDLDVRSWPDLGNADEIHYALLWNPPEDLFDKLNNLQVIFSIGAGVDGILKVESRPADIPLVRLSDQELTNGMVQYVIYSVLRVHRNMADYDQLQKDQEWGFYPQIATKDCTVGVMGLGQLGMACAQGLQTLGYKVIGFSRTNKDIGGIESFDQSRLNDFLSQTEILVCLLPLTGQTRHILNKQTFNQLPKGASVINIGRGGHLNETDLLEALDSEQINRAILDVFETEPLPQDHPFWQHPKITLTPHIASQTVPASAVNHIVNGIKKHQAGEPLDFLYDSELGY